MSQLFKIDMSGTVSPLQVFNGSGDLLFDGNCSGLRKYGLFSALVGSNLFYPAPYTVNDGTSGFTSIPFGKTFSQPPMFSGCRFVAGPLNEWHPLAMSYLTTNTGPPGGNFMTSFTNKIIFANYGGGNSQMSACVYENGVYG